MFYIDRRLHRNVGRCEPLQLLFDLTDYGACGVGGMATEDGVADCGQCIE